ncbi:2OG-Fe(II) oxygenase [Paraglaciecola sp. 2405UD69-4]|uniref:2OG-Fe(II) oxygenase n=1 Tax=Paraglaciecola sp. 2405UD69-4 TaxID=3391836 RepID=UPI0039C98155
MSNKNTKNGLTEAVIDQITDSIANDGYAVIDQFLPSELSKNLLDEAKVLSASEFQEAGIGRNLNKKLDSKIRTDTTLWLSEKSSIQGAYMVLMEHLREGINRRLYMGLSEFECHFSHYKKGDFYLRHLDAFKTQQALAQKNRRLSTVLYLNEQWQQVDGGELFLYLDEDQVEPTLKVNPLFNRCIIFLSERFPHEVCVSNTDRFSIAGWFR